MLAEHAHLVAGKVESDTSSPLCSDQLGGKGGIIFIAGGGGGGPGGTMPARFIGPAEGSMTTMMSDGVRLDDQAVAASCNR